MRMAVVLDEMFTLVEQLYLRERLNTSTVYELWHEEFKVMRNTLASCGHTRLASFHTDRKVGTYPPVTNFRSVSNDSVVLHMCRAIKNSKLQYH